MTEAAQINDPQARAEKELLLRQQYEPLLNGVLEENLDIRGNLNQSAFDDLAYLYKQDAEKFRNMTEEEKQAYLKELIPQMESGVKELADYVYGKGGFIPAVQEALDNLDQKTQEYEDGIVELQEQAGQSFGDIGNNIDDIIEKNQTLLQENKDLIQTQKDQVTAIQEVVAEIDNLVERYNNAFNAATNAMDAAHDYFTEIGNEAADAGVDDVHGVIDYWQQVYADDVMYGLEGRKPMSFYELTLAVAEGLNRGGIKVYPSDVASILKGYQDMDENW